MADDETVNVSVSMPTDLLDAVDKRAAELHMTRSELFRDYARKDLEAERRQQDGARKRKAA